MILSLRGFQQTVQDAAAAAQGAATAALDFTVGGILRSLIEACASVALWLQYVALQVLSATRLSTSIGTDADSFVGDYSLLRLPATAATGSVTLSRYATSQAALVAPGGQVKTLDGTQTFTITTDTTNPAWSVSQGGYVIASGVASVTVPVQAAVSGRQGNVIAAAIGLLATAIPNVDTVTNAVALTNGMDAETDPALKARFQLYIGSLAKATKAAVGAAVLSVQQGLTYVIQENTPGTGQFTVTINDGSGNPSTALKNAVYAAVDLVRPLGSIFSVQGPSITSVSISITLTLPASVTRAPIDAAVSLAVSAYVAALGVGAVLPFNYLSALVFGASPLIQNCAILVNGATADINPGAAGVVQASSVTVA